MAVRSLKSILGMITRRLAERDIPFAVIGALALGIYGLPRYTADIDLMAREEDRSRILKILSGSGYTCYHETAIFAQLDSELGALGRLDLMFVSTSEGRAMLERKVMVEDALMGGLPVIQPTDYIILKLMGIANDPGRRPGDEADILAVLKCFLQHPPLESFSPLDRDRLERFAARFGQEERLARLIESAKARDARTDRFTL